MKRSRLETLITGGSMLTMAVFAGGAWAAPPTQADMDLCNQKAAAAAQAAKGHQAAGAPQPGASSTNPTGGRITDSSQPGMTQMTRGMAAAGQTDSVYRQAYSVCMTQRGQQ